MRIRLSLYLLLAFTLSLNVFAQDDPAFLTANVPNYYYNPAAKHGFNAGHFALVLRNQSDTGNYQGYGGLFGGGWSGRNDKLSGTLLYEYDKTKYQLFQRPTFSGSIRICRIRNSELRFGLRLGVAALRIDVPAMIEMLGEPVDQHSVAQKKWTYATDAGLYWQSAHYYIGLSARHWPAHQYDFGEARYPSHRIYLHSHFARIYYLQAGTLRMINGNNLLRADVLLRQGEKQTIWLFRAPDVPVVTNLIDTFYRPKRNGDVKFSAMINLTYQPGSFFFGITARGFHKSVLTGGVQAGYFWKHGSKFWIAAVAPNKRLGLIVETGASLSIVRKAPRPQPHINLLDR